MDAKTIREKGILLKQKLNLNSYPVGVKFLLQDAAKLKSKKLSGHRYCQAFMKARSGEHVFLDASGITCPAAAAAFGFKPLPEPLKNGTGLVGFGITARPETGINMFKGMPALSPGDLKALYLFPLETAEIEPDVVVVEDEIEKLMWLVLAEVNRSGGNRVESSTAVLQAACVDATLIPYISHKFNMSFGCYGCRDATNIGTNETILGFPFNALGSITDFVELLAQKALPNSRKKNAYSLLRKSEVEEISKEDPFERKDCYGLK